jgi:long-subunit acyl-CoA synthetase (AMP-forming)
MKSTDALVAAWTQTVSRAKDAPGIFNASGQVVRKFSEIEEHARDFEAKIEMFDAGSVIAIQIGNHEDWPSILIACLRKRLVVLPLEQSISDHQREAALELCGARAVVSAVPSGNSPGLFRMKTPEAIAECGEHSQ